MSGFFCLWVPHFAAWTFGQSEKSLQNRAFAVCERGRVVAASPLALESGVEAGMTTGQAQSRLSDLLLVQRDRNREELAWAEVQRAFYGLTPKVEPVEVGLLFAEVEPAKVSPLLRGWGVHGGAASDRATAYAAALSAQCGHTRTVKAGSERAFADTLPLDILSEAGVSRDTLGRLQWFGWTRIGHLRALSRRQLEEQFGAEGMILFFFARGPRDPANLRPVPTWTPPEEIVASLSFELPAREPAEWDGALDLLLARVCDGLGSRQAQTLEVVAHTPVAPLSARRLLKEPLADPAKLRRPVEAALHEALRVLLPLPPVVLGLEVRLGGLVSAPVQDVLFPNEERERAKTLVRTVERLEARFAGMTGRYELRDPHSPFPEDAFGWLGALEAVSKERGAGPPARAERPRPKAVK